MAKVYGFGKEEHLYLRKEIEGLFSSDKKMLSYPYRALYRLIPEEEVAAKLLINAPKRRLKRAVDRNRVKRLIREAYRLHKGILTDKARETNTTVLLGIVYIGEELPTYERTEKAVKYFLHRITEELTSRSSDQR